MLSTGADRGLTADNPLVVTSGDRPTPTAVPATPGPTVAPVSPSSQPTPSSSVESESKDTSDDTISSKPGQRVVERLPVSVGQWFSDSELIDQWREAIQEAAESAAEALILTNSAILVDPRRTSFEDFERRLGQAIEATERAEAYSAFVEELSAQVLAAELAAPTAAERKRAVTARLEKYVEPTSLGKATPDRAGPSRSQEVRDRLRASYDDPRALRVAIRWAKEVGASNRLISAQLGALAGEVQSETWSDVATTAGRLETSAIVIKNGAALTVFAGGVALSGGGAAAAAGAAETGGAAAATGWGSTLFTGGTTLLGGLSTAIGLGEDTAYIITGEMGEDTAFTNGVKGLNELVGFFTFSGSNVASKVMYVGQKGQQGYEYFFGDKKNSRITMPDPSDPDPVVEFEELSDDELAAEYEKEFGPPPEVQPGLVPGDYRDEADGTLRVADDPTAREILGVAPLVAPDLLTVTSANVKLPPGLLLESIYESPPDSQGRSILIGSLKSTVSFPFESLSVSAEFRLPDGKIRHSATLPYEYLLGESAVPFQVDKLSDDYTVVVTNKPTQVTLDGPTLVVAELVFTKNPPGISGISDPEDPQLYEVRARVVRTNPSDKPWVGKLIFVDDNDRFVGFQSFRGDRLEVGEEHTVFVRMPPHLADDITAAVGLVLVEGSVRDGAIAFEGDLTEGVEVTDLEFQNLFETVTPYAPDENFSGYVDSLGGYAAFASGELVNVGNRTVQLRSVGQEWEGGYSPQTNIGLQTLRPGEKIAFIVRLSWDKYREILPSFNYFEAGAIPPRFPTVKLTLPDAHLRVDYPRARDLLETSFQGFFEGTHNLGSPAHGFTFWEGHMTLRNKSDRTVENALVRAAFLDGSKVVGVEIPHLVGSLATTVDLAPGESVQMIAELRTGMRVRPSGFIPYISGDCVDCEGHIPDKIRERIAGQSRLLPGQGPDVCSQFQSPSGFQVCRSLQQFATAASSGVFDNAALKTVDCNSVLAINRMTCFAIQAADARDPSSMRRFGDTGLATYIALTGDTSVLEEISSDEVRDDAFTFALVYSDEDNIPDDGHCEGLRGGHENEDVATSVCERALAVMRAFLANDTEACARLPERLRNIDFLTDEDRQAAVSECGSVTEDLFTMSAGALDDLFLEIGDEALR